MSEPKQAKVKYRVRNWSAYNHALVNRGSLTLCLSEEVLASWLHTEKSGRRGRSQTYTDVAIESMLLLRSVFRLPLRQTQGFILSLLSLLGVNLPVPNFSTLSRRQGGLKIKLPRQQLATAGIHVVVDATGLKVFGHGEWFLQKHRRQPGGKQRKNPKLWRKVHLAYNAATHEIVAVVTTEKDRHEKTQLAELLAQVTEPIYQVTGDGGYDFVTCYVEIEARGGYPVIPPRKNAAYNRDERWATRNAHLRRMAQIGRKAWKKETKYHRRSLAETAMFRLKTIFGPRLQSRTLVAQSVEVRLRCRALNRMTQLGMPEAYPVLADA